MGPAELLRELVTLTDYMKHLDKDKDAEARKENVQELISFAAEAEQGLSMFDADAGMERTQVPASASAPAQPSDAQRRGGPGAHDVIEIVDSDDEDPRSAATWAKDKGKAKVDGARSEPAAASDVSIQGTELTAPKYVVYRRRTGRALTLYSPGRPHSATFSKRLCSLPTCSRTQTTART
jgi:hypothetical protein